MAGNLAHAQAYRAKFETRRAARGIATEANKANTDEERKIMTHEFEPVELPPSQIRDLERLRDKTPIVSYSEHTQDTNLQPFQPAEEPKWHIGRE